MMATSDERLTWRRRWLAIDLGDRRVGLAVSDPGARIASPAGFLERRPGKRPPLTALLEKATALEAEGFVVGLPLDQMGEDTPRTTEARRLAHELATRTGLPAELVDERFTTAAALRAVQAMEGSTRGRRGDVDAIAATVLLQHALRLFEQREEPTDEFGDRIAGRTGGGDA
jgi:putative Holliday junction resolvase